MSAEYQRWVAMTDEFAKRVDATPSDAWSNASPCEGWTARDVVGHVVQNFRRLSVGAAATPMDSADEPKSAFDAAFAQAKAALSAPGALDREVDGPMGMKMTTAQMLGRFICNDVLVHTWDLARAVGGDESLNQEAVAAAYSGLKPLDAMMRMPGVFGPKVEPPADADLQTEFLCFLGRAV